MSARARTHTLSYFAVQPRLAEDSCLQLSVITFYLFKRYLWMWAKSLYSDPLTSTTYEMKWHGRTAKNWLHSPRRSHRMSQARHRRPQDVPPDLQESAAPTWVRATYRCTLCSLHCGFLERSHRATAKHKKNASSAQHLACLCSASQALPQGSHKSDSG